MTWLSVDTVVLGPTSQAVWRPALPAQGRPPPSCEVGPAPGLHGAQVDDSPRRRGGRPVATAVHPGTLRQALWDTLQQWQARVEEWGIPISVPSRSLLAREGGTSPHGTPNRDTLRAVRTAVAAPPAPFPNCDRPEFCILRQLLRVCWTHCFALTSLSPKLGLAQTHRTLAGKSGRYTNGEGKGEGAGATPASRPSYLVLCFTTL